MDTVPKSLVPVPEQIPSRARRIVMRRTAWIWLCGCVAWTVDGVINIARHAPQHAVLALLMALMFGIAWLFYRGQPR